MTDKRTIFMTDGQFNGVWWAKYYDTRNHRSYTEFVMWYLKEHDDLTVKVRRRRSVQFHFETLEDKLIYEMKYT